MSKRAEEVVEETVDAVEETKDGIMDKLTDRKFLIKAGKYTALGLGVVVASYIGASLVRRPVVTNNLHVDGGETK